MYKNFSHSFRVYGNFDIQQFQKLEIKGTQGLLEPLN